MGSSDVPLDSWVYGAFDRLSALGHVKSAHAGIRPWTRMECARLLEEAAENASDNSADEDLMVALRSEFASEARRIEGAANLGASVDEIYFRSSNISGPVLRDGYHFGQTIVNDEGRPYGEGFNGSAGVVAHADAGPLSIFVQGEYQHAAALPSEPANALAAAANADGTQPLPNSRPPLDRFRLLQGTVALTHGNVQLSFGQQSLWLGSNHAGPFLHSSNAEPMTMLRIASVSPYEAPLFSRLLGPVQSEFFLARMSGQMFEGKFGPGLTSQPFIHGTKLSFHPTEYLEIGAGFTAQFGGQGNPFTLGNFLRTFYSHRVGVERNPGKRLSEFEFNYRLPGLRNWALFYLDSMVIDEYSPVGSTRPAINPGIYFPRLPYLHKMDLRMEGITTDLNVPASYGPGAFYWDGRYYSGYTSNGNLIGSWIGRRGRGQQAWLTYHASARNQFQFGFRHNNVDKGFLEGGSLRDLTARADWMLTRSVGISAFVQQETWRFPLLSSATQSNVLGTFQLTFWPKKK